jgi:CRP/FNR family transcriptional regulator
MPAAGGTVAMVPISGAAGLSYVNSQAGRHGATAEANYRKTGSEIYGKWELPEFAGLARVASPQAGRSIMRNAQSSVRPAGDEIMLTGPPEQRCCLADLLLQWVPVRRHVAREGGSIFRPHNRFTEVHLIRSGVFKLAMVTWDGREKVLALRFSGEWLGFDGIAEGQHVCDASVVERGEVWSVRYDDLLHACVEHSALAVAMHRAMSDEMAGDRDAMKCLGTLSADARVANFLHSWVEALRRRGSRTDHITLHLTRSEIGNYLGLTLESVSRAFTRLAREDVIRFSEPTHREVEIRDPAALSRLVQTPSLPAARLVPC